MIVSLPVLNHHLLPRCYQDRTNHPHLLPFQEHPGLWFLVGLGRLRLGYLKFANRWSRPGEANLQILVQAALSP
jgi:hypothetical protein